MLKVLVFGTSRSHNCEILSLLKSTQTDGFGTATQVLMDDFMPIKTGWDATRDIREREAAAIAAAGGPPAAEEDGVEDVEVAGRLVVIGVTGSATTPEDTKRSVCKCLCLPEDGEFIVANPYPQCIECLLGFDVRARTSTDAETAA